MATLLYLAMTCLKCIITEITASDITSQQSQENSIIPVNTVYGCEISYKRYISLLVMQSDVSLQTVSVHVSICRSAALTQGEFPTGRICLCEGHKHNYSE